MAERMSTGHKDPSERSFMRTLSKHWKLLSMLLLLGLAWHLFLVIRFPHDSGDEVRYTAPARNMLAGRGFSSDTAAPYLPSEHTVPVYPLFIAGIYASFGERNVAVRVAQAFIDTATGVLVAFLAFQLAPVQLKRSAPIAALIIYEFLSWFTIFWTRYLLTETLAVFLTTAVVASAVWALRGSPLRWLAVGYLCAISVLTRPDSILLAVACALFLVLIIVQKRSFQTALMLIFFCCAFPVVLAPWTARNYLAFGKFQPLANPYGKPRGEYVPTGYLLWTRTWMVDETNYHVTDLVFHPGNRDFDPNLLPDYVFDSQLEREKIIELTSRYDLTGEMTPELSEEFRAVAQQRIRRSPLRFYLALPLKRVVSMWLTGFVTSNLLHMYIRVFSVLPILVGGILGLVIWARNGQLVQLIVIVIIVRTLLFSFIGTEARLIVELYPFMIAASGLSVGSLVQSLSRLTKSKAS